MPLFEIEYVKHILDEAKYITKYSKDLKFDKFRNDETLTRAFVRSIEIIGEASKKVSRTCVPKRNPKHGWTINFASPSGARWIYYFFGIFLLIGGILGAALAFVIMGIK